MPNMTEVPGPQSPLAEDPDRKGRTAIEEAATAPPGKDGKPEVSAETERTALDWLLQPPRRLEYRVPVKFDTPDGEMELRFIIRSLTGRQLREIERRNAKDGNLGPLAELDDQRVAAETVAAALVKIEDPSTGKSVDPRGEEFMRDEQGHRIPDPADVLAARFAFQSGVLSNLASEVRRISGWSTDRVGTAQRVMVDAVGSSSNGVE